MTKNLLGSLLLLCALLFATGGYAQDDQKKKDDEILKEYFKKNHIKAQKTPSGLYYTINKKGTGDNAKVGQNVTMNYLGKFMDGKQFDANMDANYQPVAGRQPFTFNLGRHQVISGWDEGVQLLNKGSRATLYLPSGLAYGPNGRGGIPPNSILIFDVEVMGIAN
jgi:FKBP-type peptidyl-prolyl cis-trans isomerase FkpA